MKDPAEFLRMLDWEVLASTPTTERYSQSLIGAESGAKECSIFYVRTPPGGESPAGLHVHDVDQHFFVIEGVISFEIAGVISQALPGSLIYFPAGVPHRNWNEGHEPTVHLAINAPLPDPNVPFARAAGT